MITNPSSQQNRLFISDIPSITRITNLAKPIFMLTGCVTIIMLVLGNLALSNIETTPLQIGLLLAAGITLFVGFVVGRYLRKTLKSINSIARDINFMCK